MSVNCMCAPLTTCIKLFLDLTDAKSLSDLATRSGYPKSVIAAVDEGLRMLVKGGEHLAKSNAAILELMDVANDLGLLYLPEHPK